MKDLFHRFASNLAFAVGSAAAFILAIRAVMGRDRASVPIFGHVALAINTGTTPAAV